MRVNAKKIAGKQMDIALKGRLGLVIDSTARDVDRIIKQKKMLEKLGYETAMVFVDTNLETALDRNEKRARTVPEDIVRKSHATIRKNRDKLKKIFGARNFWIIPNDGDLADLRKNTNKMFSKVKSWVDKPVNNKAATEWKSQFESLIEAESKHMKKVDEFGQILATISRVKYDPEDPQGSLEKQFKAIRKGKWTPKQWELIQGMANKLKDVGIKLKSLKGMYMGVDSTGKGQYYEEVINELDLRNPAQRNKTKTIANLAAFEKKLLKKMMSNPGRALQELQIAIATFEKLIGKSLPLVQPLFKAQLDKMKSMQAQLSGGKVTEETIENVAEETSIGAGSIPTGPESVGVEPDAKFAGNAVFDCDPKTFAGCIKGKKKHGRWATYLGKDNPFYGQIKQWMSQSYKNKNFIIRNNQTGSMVYARNVMGESTIKKMNPKDKHSIGTNGRIAKINHKAVAKLLSKKYAPETVTKDQVKKIAGVKKLSSWDFDDILNSMWAMESVNELFDEERLSKKEVNAFNTAVKSWKGVRPMGTSSVTANVLSQNFQVTEGLKRKTFTVALSKQKDPFKIGASFYDIRYKENKSSSQATQSSKFMKEEDVGLLKKELKRFGSTVLQKKLKMNEVSMDDLKQNKALKLYMNDPIYKAILQAKTAKEMKSAMASAYKIRGDTGVKNFQKAVKGLI